MWYSGRVQILIECGFGAVEAFRAQLVQVLHKLPADVVIDVMRLVL